MNVQLLVAAAGALLALLVLWRSFRSIRTDRTLNPVSPAWLAERRRAPKQDPYLS
jgi:hypothetical protein